MKDSKQKENKLALTRRARHLWHPVRDFLWYDRGIFGFDPPVTVEPLLQLGSSPSIQAGKLITATNNTRTNAQYTINETERGRMTH
jgi:hypothetical protein